MPRRRGPKSTKPAAKRMALGMLGVKRLSPTKSQRRAMRRFLGTQTVFGALGGRKAGVTPRAASRYTVKRTVPQYRITKEEPVFEERQVRIPGYSRYDYISGDYVRVPDCYEKKWVQVGTRPAARTLVGEKLVLKRLHRKGGGGRKGSSGDRGTHRTGTMKARRSAAKKSARASGTRGARPGRQDRKRKTK